MLQYSVCSTEQSRSPVASARKQNFYPEPASQESMRDNVASSSVSPKHAPTSSSKKLSSSKAAHGDKERKVLIKGEDLILEYTERIIKLLKQINELHLT